MELPIGYIPLREAADMIGRAVVGKNWEPLAKIGSYTIEAKLNPEIDRVIKLTAEQCAAGNISAAYRSITGADTLDQAVWLSPCWRNCFATGTIELDLPLVDEKLRPNADGFTARCTREVFVRRQDVDQLVKELAVAPQKGRAGAPVGHDWDDYRQKFQQLWEENGDFRLPENQMKDWNSKAAAARKLLDYIQTRCDEGEEPHSKTVEARIAGWVKKVDSGA